MSALANDLKIYDDSTLFFQLPQKKLSQPETYVWFCSENIVKGKIYEDPSSLQKGLYFSLKINDPLFKPLKFSKEICDMVRIANEVEVLTVCANVSSARDFLSMWISKDMDVFSFGLGYIKITVVMRIC